MEVLGDGGGGRATHSGKPGRLSGQRVMDQKVREKQQQREGDPTPRAGDARQCSLVMVRRTVGLHRIQAGQGLGVAIDWFPQY